MPPQDTNEGFSWPPPFLLAMLALNLAGVSANYISFRRIAGNFDTGRVIFRLLQVDIMLSLLGCAADVVLVFVFFCFDNDLASCTLYFVATLFPMLYGMLISGILSVLRYLSLIYGHLDGRQLEFRFSMAAHTILGLFTIASIITVLLHITVITPFKVIGYCMHGPSAAAAHPGSAAFWAITGMTSCLVSLFFGALTAKRVKSQVAAAGMTTGSTESGKNMYTIPVRATVLAAAVAVVSGILVTMVHKSSIPPGTHALATSIVTFAMNALRCPLTTFLTFSAKRSVDKRSKWAKQEWELKHARMEKEERDAANSTAVELF